MATQQAVDRRERRDARLGSVGEPRELAVDRRLTPRGLGPPGRARARPEATRRVELNIDDDPL